MKTLNDKKCLSNSIAVGRNFKNKNGEYETDFFNFTVWGNQAEYLHNYCKKGDRIALVGKLLNTNYEKNGETIYSNSIQVESVEILWGSSNKNDDQDAELNRQLADKLGDDVIQFLD